MSLINQMLQDLEKRRAAPITGIDMPDQLRATAQKKPRRRFPVLLVVLLLALGGGAWLLMKPHRKQVVPRPLGAPVVAVSPPVPVVAAPPLQVVLPAPPPIPEPPLPVMSPPPPANPVALPPISTMTMSSELTLELLRPHSSHQEPSSPQPRHATATASPAQPMGAVPAGSSVATAAQPKSEDGQAAISKQARELTPEQRAESHYRKADDLLQLGRVTQAKAELVEALKIEPRHLAARQTLAYLLVEDKRFGEAEQQLEEGLKLSPEQAGFAMALARLQVERGGVTEALATLERTLPFAADKAEFRAFYAALLQRQQRHKEAIAQYQAALSIAPSSGVWLMGLGISLQAEKKLPEAREAYSRARASGTLSPSLSAFVEQRLRQIQP
jgi:MSHA biogenesis protein MshN